MRNGYFTDGDLNWIYLDKSQHFDSYALTLTMN